MKLAVTTALTVVLTLTGTASATLVATSGDLSGVREDVGFAGINYQLGNHLYVDGGRAAISNGNINGQSLSVKISYNATAGEYTTSSGNSTDPAAVAGPFNDIVLFSRFDNRDGGGNNVNSGFLDINNFAISLNGIDQGMVFSDAFFDQAFVTGENQFTFGTLSMDGLSTQDIEITFDIVSSYTTNNSRNNNAGSRIVFQADFIEVPEPSSLALLGLGGLLVSHRRRNR